MSNIPISFLKFQASLTVSLLIVFCACVIAWALRISYLTHLNEAKLSKILSTLAMKFPDLDMELKTISTHQEIVVAPIYYLAKLVSILYVRFTFYHEDFFSFGPLSSGLIILLDRAMKMLFSLGTISGIAYLILQHSNSNRVGESKVAADDIFTRNEAGPDDALFGS